jgi:hypothetical protein
MAKRGLIQLPTRHVAATLHLAGWAPLEFLKEAPTVLVTINDHEIDRFAPSGRTFSRDYRVDPAMTGESSLARLVLETSATAQAPGDPRDLGLSITELDWRQAGP